MELGELIIVDEKFDREFYHVKTYVDKSEKLKEGEVYYTEKRDINRWNKTEKSPKRFREEGFEKVRKEMFPNYPSRYNCIFLSENKEGLEYWNNILGNRPCIGIQKVIIRPIEGKLLSVDERIYELTGLESILIEEDAKDYFFGCELATGAIVVILFEGKYEVVKIISEVSYLR